MSLRCFVGLHDPGALVGRGSTLHVRCARCQRLSPGVAIDGPRPRVTHIVEPVEDAPAVAEPHTSPIWWLKGVYERPGA